MRTAGFLKCSMSISFALGDASLVDHSSQPLASNILNWLWYLWSIIHLLRIAKYVEHCGCNSLAVIITDNAYEKHSGISWISNHHQLALVSTVCCSGLTSWGFSGSPEVWGLPRPLLGYCASSARHVSAGLLGMVVVRCQQVGQRGCSINQPWSQPFLCSFLNSFEVIIYRIICGLRHCVSNKRSRWARGLVDVQFLRGNAHEDKGKVQLPLVPCEVFLNV